MASIGALNAQFTVRLAVADPKRGTVCPHVVQLKVMEALLSM